jgi:DNA-directed RNA polymerase subunit M/transcription elongation factor TFIIS
MAEPEQSHEDERERHAQDIYGERTQAWLQEQGLLDNTCPSCGQHDWQFGGVVNLQVRPGGNHLPVASLICTTCAHAWFLSAVKAKVVRPGEPPDEDAAFRQD